jgi:glycosyltransferase involved in cell wall biosynthesis
VISVGSINKLKNQKFLLEVVERIPLNLRPKLILVGNGGDKKYIQTLIEYAKSKSINLKIYCDLSRKRLIDLYKHSYVFMYAPINEPYGLVVLEAIKAGLPLMVSNSGGGYNEVIDKNNGYILRNDSDLWARTYVKLLSNHIEWKKLSIYNYDNSFKYSDINYHTKLSRLITKYL